MGPGNGKINPLSSRSGITLIIGDLDRWQAQGRALPELEGMYFADVTEVTPDLVLDLQPEIVLSPLFARDFDAVEIASRLFEIGFTGRYRILADGVPNVGIVQREIRSVAPGLDFAVLNMSVLRGLS